MMAGDLIGGRYRLAERLNQGSFGVVWRAEELLQGKPIASVALKVFTIEVNHGEIEALARLQHGHILSYRTAVEHAGQLCLITEFADGGDLGQMLKSYPDGLPAARVREVVKAVASALHYLHGQSWVHRDIKPSNILYVGTTPKLADVGTAKAIGSAMTRHTGVGSVAYSAPEMFSGQVGAPSDIYALGITTFELLAGRLPFDGAAENVMRQHLIEEATIPADFPEDFQALLKACLTKKAADRPSAEDVLRLIERPVVVSTPPAAAPRVKPEQLAAEMTRYIRHYLDQHPTQWDSPAVWGPFWQELKQLAGPIGLADSDLMRQVQALRDEMFPPAAPVSPPAPKHQAAPAAAPPPPRAEQQSTPRQATTAERAQPSPPPRSEPQAAPRPASPKSQPAPAVIQLLVEHIQTYGNHWSQSDVWQPFWTKLRQTAPDSREREIVAFAEELEQQLSARTKHEHQMQLRILQWVSALGSRSYYAKDWVRFLESAESLRDETLAARYRDDALQRLYPKQTGELRKLAIRRDLTIDLVFMGQDVLGNSIPLSDLADAVIKRDESKSQQRTPPRAAKGVWLSLAPLTIAQWYGLLQLPLPAQATKPEATARVRLPGVTDELLPRMRKRFPLEELRLATRAEAHALRKLLESSRPREKSASSRDPPPDSLLGILGLAAVAVMAQVASENQEWFHNDAPAASEAKAQPRLPLRLASIVPA